MVRLEFLLCQVRLVAKLIFTLLILLILFKVGDSFFGHLGCCLGLVTILILILGLMVVG